MEEVLKKRREGKEHFESFSKAFDKKRKKNEEYNKAHDEKTRIQLEIQELHALDETTKGKKSRIWDEEDPNTAYKIQNQRMGSRKITQAMIFQALEEFKDKQAVEDLKKDIKKFRKKQKAKASKKKKIIKKEIAIEEAPAEPKTKKQKETESIQKSIKLTVQKVINFKTSSDDQQ